MTTHECLAGIFVGGQSRRMLGTPKGLLQPPGSAQNLVERLADKLTAAGVRDLVLVGDNEAYHHFSLSVVPDAPVGKGPMAGLLGLAEYAAKRQFECVLVVACDMPNVDETLLRRLHRESSTVAALVPKREHWEPLCARYRVQAILPHLRRLLAEGQYRMTSLLELLGPTCKELPIEPVMAEALQDWDAPSDLPKGVTCFGRPHLPWDR